MHRGVLAGDFPNYDLGEPSLVDDSRSPGLAAFSGLAKRRLRIQGARISSNDGTHTHTNSFMNVVAPAELKNAHPIGEETIGRHAEKIAPN
jgi:hypothetical protein